MNAAQWGGIVSYIDARIELLTAKSRVEQNPQNEINKRNADRAADLVNRIAVAILEQFPEEPKPSGPQEKDLSITIKLEQMRDELALLAHVCNQTDQYIAATHVQAACTMLAELPQQLNHPENCVWPPQIDSERSMVWLDKYKR